ncbi:MAG: V-type ATP synthase subunit B, partial [Chloroflexota bacterium]|nr:V-type ATP synthase subunit B [Chloroflexota bacterium]
MNAVMNAGAQEVRGVSRIEGPIVVVEGVYGVGYDEVVEVIDQHNHHRQGRVLEVGEGMAVVEVFAGTTGLSVAGTRVRFHGQPMRLPVSEEMLGRTFDGLGNPIDDAPPPLADYWADINGEPVNPTARIYPREAIQTGISSIDGMNTLVLGQKVPIFSGSGLPHNRLAAQIVRQATLPTVAGQDSESRDFVVVFAAMGVKHDVAEFFRNSFASSGA